MGTRLPHAALVVALTIAPSAAQACVGPSASSSAKRLVRYDREGGIAGTAARVTFDVKGHGARSSTPPIACGPNTDFKLTSKRFTKLRALLKALKISTLAPSYGPTPPGSIADGITETVHYQGHAVAVMTGAHNVPSRLTKLLTFIRSYTSG